MTNEIKQGRNYLSRDSKELFEQRFVKFFDQIRKHVEARNQRTGTTAGFIVPW